MTLLRFGLYGSKISRFPLLIIPNAKYNWTIPRLLPAPPKLCPTNLPVHVPVDAVLRGPGEASAVGAAAHRALSFEDSCRISAYIQHRFFGYL